MLRKSFLFRHERAVRTLDAEEGGFAGNAPVPSFTGSDYTEYERFSPDKDWMPRLVLIAKNSYVWLDQLSRKYQRSITHLGHIPDEELDLLQQRGITGLWLIGLWERSIASRRMKQMMGQYDAVASAYSLMDYEIAADLGGSQFTYAHVVQPHPPFVFDQDGKPLDDGSLLNPDWNGNEKRTVAYTWENYRQGYIQQVEYVSWAILDPLQRILDGFAKCGVVGEETNKLVGYLASISRRLETPLAVVVQSSSAAGKSLLMDAIERAGSTEPAAIQTALNATQGFVGPDGVYNYSATNHDGLTADDMIIVKIEGGTWVLVE